MSVMNSEYFDTVLAKPPTPGDASKYILPEYHYLIAEQQFTVGHVAKVQHMLNDAGKQLLADVQGRVLRGEFKDRFDRGGLKHELSGLFYATDRYRQEHPECDYKICLNSHHNIRLYGSNPAIRAVDPCKNICTSFALLYGDDWIYTSSGSLYSFPVTQPPNSDNDDISNSDDSNDNDSNDDSNDDESADNDSDNDD